jgi:hypothetical protein
MERPALKENRKTAGREGGREVEKEGSRET